MRNIRRIGLVLLALCAVALMIAPFAGCASSSGSTAGNATTGAPAFDPLKFGLGYLKDAVKSARVTVSLTKEGGNICVQFGLADSSGHIWIGTAPGAMLSFDAPCFNSEAFFNQALSKSMAGPTAPKVIMVLPVRADSGNVGAVRGGR